ncbi:MAG TPA: ABC transporter permease [Bauldia sp.]|nr:ABC transporter permease [Bauldia sp.]
MGRRLWYGLVRWDLASVTLALVVIAVALMIGAPAFHSAYNLRALGFTIAVTGVVALAQVTVLSVGQFNLALTSIGAMVGLLSGWLMQVGGLPWFPAVMLGIAFGALSGALQGWIIVRSGINAFIVSLALAAAYFGAMLGLSRGASFNQLPPSYVALGRASLFGVPWLLIFSVAVAAIVSLVFTRTVGGRKLLATGANPRTALMSGIATGRVTIAAHTLSGLLAGIAAVMLVARLGSAQPSLGSEWLLPSFAAPVLGGTLLTGGRVLIVGTYLGALLLAVIANGLVLFGVSAYWYQSLLGVVLLLALAIDRSRQSYVLRHQL